MGSRTRRSRDQLKANSKDNSPLDVATSDRMPYNVSSKGDKPLKAKSLKSSAKVVELPSASTTSLDRKVRDLRSDIEEALRSNGSLPKKTKKVPYAAGGIEELYANTVVFYDETYSNLFACNYTLSENGQIELTAKVAVERRTTYVPTDGGSST